MYGSYPTIDIHPTESLLSISGVLRQILRTLVRIDTGKRRQFLAHIQDGVLPKYEVQRRVREIRNLVKDLDRLLDVAGRSVCAPPFPHARGGPLWVAVCRMRQC